MWWKFQPTANSVRGTTQNPEIQIDATNSGIDTTMSGMPTVWQNRLTGF
jgi:hypothetical protein